MNQPTQDEAKKREPIVPSPLLNSKRNLQGTTMCRALTQREGTIV